MADRQAQMNFSQSDGAKSGVEQQLMARSRERQEFDNHLADFPHSFQLKKSDLLTPAALLNIKNHLEASLDFTYRSLKDALEPDHYKTILEIERMHNLLAFVLFRLRQYNEAIDQLDKALKLQEDNIVSLANKAVILWRIEKKRDAECLVNRLLDLKENPRFRDLETKAKAELAWSYLRFGRQYVELAVKGFKEVIKLASEPEKSMWKYGLAVAYRQSIDLQSLPFLKDQTETSVREEALRLLLNVTVVSQSQNLKANAHAEIGLLIHTGAWDQESEQKLCCIAKTSAVKSIKEALKLDGNDPHVMLKAGRLFRYKKNLGPSKNNLEKALEKQQSSSGYHHLGLTFKAMATNKKHGKSAVKRGGRRKQRKNQSMATKKEAPENESELGGSTTVLDTEEPMDIASTFDVKSSGHEGTRYGEETTENSMDSGFCSNDFSACSEAMASNEPMEWEVGELEDHMQNDLVIDTDELEKCVADQDHAGSSRQAGNLRKLMRAIKSPKKMTTLDKDNEFVVEAINNFEAAIRFSKEENTRAMYDLGLLYRACGMNEEALDVFRRIYTKKDSSVGPLDVIGAYEQSGLILLEQSAMTDNKMEKENKLKDAENMLNMALSDSAKYYSRLPLVGFDIQRVWRSLACLLKLTEENDAKDHYQKLKDKLKVLMMVKNHGKTLPLVQKLELLADETQDDEGLMLCVENYAKMEKYDKAVQTIGLMLNHPRGQQFQELYINAAKQKLLEKTKTAGTVARKYFVTVFREAFAQTDTSGTSGTDSTSSDEDASEDLWDVMLLHDEDADTESVASNLYKILEGVCALKVTAMAEDARAERVTSDEVVRNIQRSKVRIIVLGSGQKRSRLLQHYLSYAATLSHVCVLTLHSGCHIPKSLKLVKAEGRVYEFPMPLMNMGKSEDGGFMFIEETVNAVACLFSIIIKL